MRRGNALRNPNQQLGVAEARAALVMLLLNATDEKVERLTVESLARMHRVPAREIECRLLAEQDRRRRNAA